MENTVNLSPIDQFQQEIDRRQVELNDLRLNGVTKIENLKNEITNVKKNKQLDKETKGKIIAKCKAELELAKENKESNKDIIAEKVADFINYIKVTSNGFIQEKKASNKAKFAELKAKYQEDLAKENERYKNALAETKAAGGENLASEIKDLKVAHVQIAGDLKVNYHDECDKLKDELHQLYLMRFNAIENANNKKMPIAESIEQKAENYKYNFNWKTFILNNGLYLAIVALLIFAIIIYAVQEHQFLLNLSTILLILNQTSPKVFLALGVAGLIVLAGTDLSVGRLVGLASVLTGMLVTTSGTTSVTFFGISPDFSALPLGLRVVLAFLISIVACVIITSIAGFFSAKFKMHPFISTLATQLFTFGMLAGITGNAFTGNPDPGVKEFVSGFLIRYRSTGLSYMIIYAIIGIIIMWFIWNKTKFGKNMFAVGGNPEAASVSGISVFWVTLAVFMLAGIYYGIGGSMFGIYSGNVRAQTGQGMETDAIAACVVGGVSFTGGVGKIRGVVIGALLFTMITVILPYIGITDTNFQLAIKGVIVLAAVALDCAKYLKKK